MQATIEECNRRRVKQLAYNKEHHITPVTIKKAITEGIEEIVKIRRAEEKATGLSEDTLDKTEAIKTLEEEMERLATELRFEEAAALRDRILELQGQKVESKGGVLSGLRKKRRGAPSQAERGREAPAPYGKRRPKR